VLLTSDDEGCAKDGIPEPRVRQNVLLELGYFIALLGRANVCALKRGTVEIPSDFAGVLWGGRMQAGGSIDSAIAFGSRIALRLNVNTSNTATHVIQARMILAVRGHERS
jgi:hypothetical protein